MIKTQVVVFGCQSFSDNAAYLLSNDANHRVVGHVVDAAYLPDENSFSRQVVSFERLSEAFPAANHSLIVPLGWKHSNQLRQEKCGSGKKLGYSLLSYVSSRASIWPNTPIGENVLIFEGVIIQPFVQLGDNIIIRSGANIGHHSVVQSNVFIASGVVTGGNVTIEENASIGLGAIIRDNVRIGARCFIGAGAVVTADTEPDGVYVGVPARRLQGKTSLDVTI